MDIRPALHAYLDWPTHQNPMRAATVAVIEALASAAIELAGTIAAGPLGGVSGEAAGVNPDGDRQRDIDLVADRLMREALRSAPVLASPKI